MNNKILKVNNVEKYYSSGGKNSVRALGGITFEVDNGEFLSIMGASGSGKTTLLNCLATIDNVSSGHIFVDNQDITKLNQKLHSKFRREVLGFIFQEFNLLDHLTIRENIALALSINNIKTSEIDTRVLEISKKLGIENILNHYPHETSGGQKQRCACARAIINNPKLILADEPTGALDSNTSIMLLESLNALNKELKSTILMVTHDAMSASYTNRVIILKDGKIFNEIYKGEKTREKFFTEILTVMTVLGGSNLEKI